MRRVRERINNVPEEMLLLDSHTTKADIRTARQVAPQTMGPIGCPDKAPLLGVWDAAAELAPLVETESATEVAATLEGEELLVGGTKVTDVAVSVVSVVTAEDEAGVAVELADPDEEGTVDSVELGVGVLETAEPELVEQDELVVAEEEPDTETPEMVKVGLVLPESPNKTMM